jgi:peptidoglycan DL-endopeptidase CwlO
LAYRIRRRYRRVNGKFVASAVVVGLLLAASSHGHAPASGAAASTAPSPAPATAIAYARAQLGKPYIYGGPTAPGTSGGFDCSGLVMMAYQAAGVSIPRTSEDQWAALPHVPSPEPGDLVFFAGSDGTVASPGHVVLYIGDGKVIQAYATGWPVMISSLASMNAGGLTGYARPS